MKKTKNDLEDEYDMEIAEEETSKMNDSKTEELKSKLKEKERIIESLEKLLSEKEKDIINLKNEIKESNINNQFNKTFYTRDQILALNFISTDQKLHYAVPCVKKDIFADVEKKLYDRFPEFLETNNTFLAQGNVILRFKTIEENKLESGIPIVMKV